MPEFDPISYAKAQRVATTTAEIAQQINDMTDNGNLAKSKVLTQTEYDALVTAGTLDEHAEYIIVEEVV